MKISDKNNKKHRHLFIYIGGGCFLGKAKMEYTDRQCDDEYSCKCGKKEKVWTTYQKHFKMPNKMGTEKLKSYLT